MMRLYSTYEKASKSMADDGALSNALSECILTEQIEYAIETGTYRGLGSTPMVANAFLKSRSPRQLITIESNWSNWRTARINLSKYDFVKVLWGQSVALDNAIRFINSDPVLQRHEEYPDIWIDDIHNPREFYIKEIQGRLGDDSSRIANLIMACAKPFFYRGDDLLERYLNKFQERNPLIILDSAGGTGYLEFTTVLTNMAQNSFTILLDDIHHLKHFRSFEEINSNDNFKILAVNKELGWVLAKYK
jgi:hypothetical protein